MKILLSWMAATSMAIIACSCSDYWHKEVKAEAQPNADQTIWSATVTLKAMSSGWFLTIGLPNGAPDKNVMIVVSQKNGNSAEYIFYPRNHPDDAPRPWIPLAGASVVYEGSIKQYITEPPLSVNFKGAAHITFEVKSTEAIDLRGAMITAVSSDGP